MFSSLVQSAPALPMPRVTMVSASTKWACSGPNTCSAGHWSRLPSMIGCSPPSAAASTSENSSSQLVGASRPSASSFDAE